jgi:hypothetical protein
MLFSHWTRERLKQRLLSKEERLAKWDWDLAESCPHDVGDRDACPCNGAIWYGQDRVEEGMTRLENGDALLGLVWWYLRSSSEWVLLKITD